jgi:prepilin-type N-terminal cleavage/methylation domain-containing protein
VRRRGFTLFELVLVIAIMAVVAAIAAPRYAAAAARYELRAAAQQLQSDIVFAQRTAQATSRSWRVVIASDGLSYTVEMVPKDELVIVGGRSGAASSLESSVADDDLSANAEVSGSDLKASEVNMATAKLGVSKLEPRVLRSSRLLVNGSVAQSVGIRTLIFDGFGMPSHEVTLKLERGSFAMTVQVTASGEVTIK